MTEGVHPIELESYRIMADLVDLDGWAEPERQVVARMIHATADESFAATARIGANAVASGLEALARRATVVCDARMVAAGVPSVASATDVVCYLDRVDRPPSDGDTRSAAAIELAAIEHPESAIWVIGNAPTALARLIDLHASGRLRPACVIGVPVGYVGAAEAKQALWESPLHDLAITNEGRRGGSPVAAAALNALFRLVQAPPR
jgi:precorrin-8X/cobalt-precorrin-8 methylmutase